MPPTDTDEHNSLTDSTDLYQTQDDTDRSHIEEQSPISTNDDTNTKLIDLSCEICRSEDDCEDTAVSDILDVEPKKEDDELPTEQSDLITGDVSASLDSFMKQSDELFSHLEGLRLSHLSREQQEEQRLKEQRQAVQKEVSSDLDNLVEYMRSVDKRSIHRIEGSLSPHEATPHTPLEAQPSELLLAAVSSTGYLNNIQVRPSRISTAVGRQTVANTENKETKPPKRNVNAMIQEHKDEEEWLRELVEASRVEPEDELLTVSSDDEGEDDMDGYTDEQLHAMLKKDSESSLERVQHIVINRPPDVSSDDKAGFWSSMFMCTANSGDTRRLKYVF